MGRKENAPSRIKRFLLKFCSIVKKHWIASAILLTASGWWFSLGVTFFGTQLRLVSINEQGGRTLTFFGWVCTVAVFLLIVIITLVNKYNQTFSEEERKLQEAEARNQTYQQMIGLFGQGCELKTNTALKYIERVIDGDVPKVLIYTNPCNQLQQLLSAMCAMLSTVLSYRGGHSIGADELYASLAFRMPKHSDNNWKWADVRRQRGLSLSEVTTSPKSTFTQLINSGKRSIFYNSKEKAKAADHYVEDSDDQSLNGKLLGSIACYKLEIKHNNVILIEAVLSLSSYGKAFATEEDEDVAQKNIEDFIVGEFEKRIHVELCNYYMTMF